MSRRAWLIALSVAAHAIFAFCVVALDLWGLERLDGPRGAETALAIAIPQSSAGGGTSPSRDRSSEREVVQRVVRRVARDIAQPTQARNPMRDLSVTFEGGGGEGHGVGRGMGDGVGDGICLEEPCGDLPTLEPLATVPLPRVPEPPRSVRTDELAAHRISGETQIEPSDAGKKALLRKGRRRTAGDFQVCLSATGTVESVQLASSTGLPAYDLRLAEAMRHWRYRPYTVDGKGVAVCGSVRFIYTVTPVPQRPSR